MLKSDVLIKNRNIESFYIQYKDIRFVSSFFLIYLPKSLDSNESNRTVEVTEKLIYNPFFPPIVTRYKSVNLTQIGMKKSHYTPSLSHLSMRFTYLSSNICVVGCATFLQIWFQLVVGCVELIASYIELVVTGCYCLLPVCW